MTDFAYLIISNSLHYFRPCIQHERTITRDRFIDRFSAEDKQHRILLHIQVDAFSIGT
jgi:hypothetical protein